MSQTDLVYGFHAVHALLQCHPQQAVQLQMTRQVAAARGKLLLQLAEQHGVEVCFVSAQQLPHKVAHQGIVMAVKQLPSYDEHDLLQWVSEAAGADAASPLLLLILDGVQDPHNLGACLRTANAHGVSAVVIPRRQAVGVTATVRKVACGAVEATPVVEVTNLARCLQSLQQQGVWLVGLDAQAEMPLAETDLKTHVAMVMGGEAQGMRRLTKSHCDFLVHIPMQGSVSSLNVSAATAICLYEACRQRRHLP